MGLELEAGKCVLTHRAGERQNNSGRRGALGTGRAAVVWAVSPGFALRRRNDVNWERSGAGCCKKPALAGAHWRFEVQGPRVELACSLTSSRLDLV